MGTRITIEHAKYLWLAIPTLGLAELLAHVYFSRRYPTLDEWRALRSEVAHSSKIVI